MARVALAFWAGRLAAPLVLAVAGVGVILTWRVADLSPRVEPEFFFAEDDPRVRESLGRSGPRDGLGSQPIIVRVEDLGGDEDAYEDRVEALAETLAELESVTAAYSIADQDVRRSPMFAALLLTDDPAATNVVLETRNPDPESFVAALEEAMAAHRGNELDIQASGVPVLMELIRRNLLRDLIVFSAAAAIIFGLLIALLYRDFAISVGALVTCALSVSATLLLVNVLGGAIGLLTANIVTITFVLTLSHVVFMTANWRRARRETDKDADDARRSALGRGMRSTFEGSFWAMATTGAGFLSLLFASAQPLQELGAAGAIAAVTALAVAYLVYPAFLGRWAGAGRNDRKRGQAGADGPAGRRMGRLLADRVLARGRRASRLLLPATAAVTVIGALGLPRLDTDPGLLAYFDGGGPIRAGLEQIDRDGGSSTLDFTVRSGDGSRLDNDESFARLGALQEALEADSVVGVILSPVTLVGHARTFPLAGFAPLSVIIDISLGPLAGRIGRAHFSDDRLSGHFNLRMRESLAGEGRDRVMERVRRYAAETGFDVTRMGGVYHLQAELGGLIRESLVSGIAALLAFFLLVGAAVSRNLPTMVRMWACLAAVPAIVLGGFGHLGMAVDIITSPAANVALAIGVDAMIHLVVRVRKLARTEELPWREALIQIGPPVMGATLLVCVGFGIFALSTFPPTARFGIAVTFGTLVAATMALVVLPRWAVGSRPGGNLRGTGLDAATATVSNVRGTVP